MSTVMNQDVIAPAANTEAPRPPWILAFGVTAVAIALVALVKWYQHAFSWTVGLDSFSDEFQVYWMRIFYAQIIGLPLLGAIGAAWLWLTRDRDIQNLPARDELARFYAMFSILVVAAIALISALGLLTEADAAWHQVVVRDTDFTPTHIFLFYLGIPAGLGGLAMAWIWVHTRLPYFANRVSLPLSLAIIGFMMAGPVVAFNEWAHEGAGNQVREHHRVPQAQALHERHRQQARPASSNWSPAGSAGTPASDRAHLAGRGT